MNGYRFFQKCILGGLCAGLVGCHSGDPNPPLTAEAPPRLEPKMAEALAMHETETVAEVGAVGTPERENGASPLVIPEPERIEHLLNERKAVGKQGATKFAHVPPLVDPERAGSVSIGTVSSGRLIDGVAIPREGPGFSVFDKVMDRSLYFGTEELVRALKNAAREVAQKMGDGAPMRIGNLGRESGGDISFSASHNSGRDADIAFFVTDAAGRSVVPTWYTAFDSNGQAEDGSGLHFDAGRNWALVEALLRDTSVQVQYLFVADWLREILLDYAVRMGADGEIVSRAERVLHQPADAAPHGEHFHLRLYCDLNDSLRGCHDLGRRHPWIETWDQQIEQRIEQLIQAHRSGIPSEREAALRELDILQMRPDERDSESENVAESL